MKRSLCWGWLGLLLLTGWAFAQSSTPEELAPKIEAAYSELGPRYGCLLYEPDWVLTLAGVLPEARHFPRGSEEPDIDVGGVNALLGTFEARLEVAGGLSVQSLKGLERLTGQYQPEQVQPFQASTGWAGYKEWVRSAKDEIRIDLLKGTPPLSLRCEERLEADPVDYVRYLRSNCGPYPLAKEAGSPDFRLLPEQVSDQATLQEEHLRARYLKNFYALPQVRERLAQAAFLQARRALRPDIYGDAVELFLRGDRLVGGEAFEVTGYAPTASQERVLAQQIEELEKQIAGGEIPSQWHRSLQDACLKAGLQERLRATHLQEWIWRGGYDRCVWRARLYRAVKARRPEMIVALAQARLRRWQESPPRSEYDLTNVVARMSHPDMKAEFAKLSAQEKAELLEPLEAYADNIHLRLLLAEPPYK